MQLDAVLASDEDKHYLEDRKFSAATCRELQPLAFIVLVVTIFAGLLHTARRHDAGSESRDSN